MSWQWFVDFLFLATWQAVFGLAFRTVLQSSWSNSCIFSSIVRNLPYLSIGFGCFREEPWNALQLGWLGYQFPFKLFHESSLPKTSPFSVIGSRQWSNFCQPDLYSSCASVWSRVRSKCNWSYLDDFFFFLIKGVDWHILIINGSLVIIKSL